MPDRTFGEPADDDEWISRRDDLVAELRQLPDQSRELRRFTAALEGITDLSQLQLVFAWLEQQGGSSCAGRE